MYFSAEQVRASGKAGFDALNMLVQIQLGALERVSALNFNVCNTAFATLARLAQRAAGVAEGNIPVSTAVAAKQARTPATKKATKKATRKAR